MRIKRMQNWVIAVTVFSAALTCAFTLHSQELTLTQEKQLQIYQPKQTVYLTNKSGYCTDLRKLFFSL
jgi:uncharacterized protein involved in exopolysaccharide biosynthesis